MGCASSNIKDEPAIGASSQHYHTGRSQFTGNGYSQPTAENTQAAASKYAYENTMSNSSGPTVAPATPSTPGYPQLSGKQYGYSQEYPPSSIHAQMSQPPAAPSNEQAHSAHSAHSAQRPPHTSAQQAKTSSSEPHRPSPARGHSVTPDDLMMQAASEPWPVHHEEPVDAIHQVAGPTKALLKLSDAVMNVQTSDDTFEKLKKLGQGGFGTVWLCRRTSARSDRRQMPEYFALKELSSNKLFRPGKDTNLKEYLPLNEPSIQQYMKHEAIVETYWADVRCLDPKTGRPLDIAAGALNNWTSLDNIADIEATYTATADHTQQPNMPEAVKLQMRIAMEHCDLGKLQYNIDKVSTALRNSKCPIGIYDGLALAGELDKDFSVLSEGAIGRAFIDSTDYLVDPAKPPTKPLAQEISWNLGSRINKIRCALLTALDIAEALKFMHKSTTLHGDLKPHNILLVTDKRDEKLFRAKISDFGLSAHMTAGQTQVNISQGTEAYLPKEVFQNLAVTEASDIYAMGLLMWEIFYGIFWFIVWDTEKRRKNVKLPQHMDGYRPSCSPSCPKDFAAIIHDCLSSTPENRPSAGDVVARLINAIGQTPAEREFP